MRMINSLQRVVYKPLRLNSVDFRRLRTLSVLLALLLIEHQHKLPLTFLLRLILTHHDVPARRFGTSCAALVCLAINSKWIISCLIIMIGPWLRAIVQLGNRKYVSLKFPHSNGNAESCCVPRFKPGLCLETGDYESRFLRLIHPSTRCPFNKPRLIGIGRITLFWARAGRLWVFVIWVHLHRFGFFSRLYLQCVV